MDYRLQRADGEYRWILECGTPHTTADGVFAGCIGSGIDVTDQKLARLILEHFNHDLLDADETERAKIARELHDDLAQRIAAVTMIPYNRDQSAAGSRLGARRFASHQRGAHVNLPGHSGAVAPAASGDSRISWSGESGGVVLPRHITTTWHEDRVLHGSQTTIELDVTDDGVGFDPQTAARTHRLGLGSMTERARLMEGELTIESRPGSGTRIRASVPVRGGNSSDMPTERALDDSSDTLPASLRWNAS